MNRNLFTAFYLFIAILIAACAKVSTPSGGARDRIPPVAVESIPEAYAVNFTGDKLEITFNEYVVLDNINDKFMVSPPMKKKPRVFIKGKSVIAEFEESLSDSTTYTFYFQDAIKDLNEGNILQNYSFVLSTGPVVDSLTVTGNVYSSLNLEVPEKPQVLLYRALADSAVKKHLPDYISMVNENGYFTINNVKEGFYRLYALKDADNSKNYNLEDEEFAFADSVIRVTPGKNFIPQVKDTVKVKKTEKADTIPGEHQLFLFKSLRKNHYLAGSSRDLKYKMQYFLSLPADTLPFEFSIPGAGDDGYFIENNVGKDSITVWLTDSTLYSEQQLSTIIRYPFTDTLGVTGQKEDTVLMRFIAPRATRGRKEAEPALSVRNSIVAGALKPGQKIVFTSLTPLQKPDTNLIRLYDETDTVRISVPFKLIQDSSTRCRYYLETNLIPGNKYFFLADSASFSNIYNEYSDSTGINFTVKKVDTYSKLRLNILNNKGDLIIQLMNKTENVLEELYTKDSGVIEFPLLVNGFYRLRAVYDLNGDRKWTTGDFPEKRQPEPVTYYPGEIDIKTGWEVEQDWDLGVRNFKIQKLKEKKKAGR